MKASDTTSVTSEPSSSTEDCSTVSTHDATATLQTSMNEDIAESSEARQALVQQFGKLKSPSEILEFVGKSPMEFQKLFTSLSRMNDMSSDQNQQLTTRVGALSQEVEVLESCQGMFRQFSKLPIEIRNMIWKLASDVPRLIRVNFYIDFDPCHLTCYFDCYPNKVPAVLHTSQESREQALKSYGLCQHGPSSWGKSRYFNPKYDILYIRIVWDPSELLEAINFMNRSLLSSSKQLLDHFPMQRGFTNSKLRRIAFDLGSWENKEKQIIHFSAMYPNLEEFIIIDETYVSSSYILVSLNEEDNLACEPSRRHMVHTQKVVQISNVVQISKFAESVAEAFEKELKPCTQFLHLRNPWLEEGRKPPSISIMRQVPLDYVDSSPWIWGR